MPYLILADDLTGANATGAALRRTGVLVVTGLRLTDVEDVGFFLLNTNTREVDDRTAYRSIRAALEQARRMGWNLFGRRVDSTWRGPVSGEIRAMLEAFPEAIVACVPAAPGAGRTLVDGRLLVHGVPVDQTEMRGVPVDLPDRLRRETGYAVCSVPLPVVRRGVKAMVQRLMHEKARIYVFDGTEEGDVRAVAEAMANVREERSVIAVDPGPFTVEWAKVSGLVARAPRIFCVMGSRTTLTQNHVEELIRHGACLLEVKGGNHEEGRIVEVLLTSEAEVVGVYASQEQEADPQSMQKALARIAAACLGGRSHDGLYLTGGNTALAVYTVLRAQGTVVDVELYPLVAAGRLIGGRCDGLPVMTKGGFVRPPDSAVDLLEAFGTHIRMLKGVGGGGG